MLTLLTNLNIRGLSNGQNKPSSINVSNFDQSGFSKLRLKKYRVSLEFDIFTSLHQTNVGLIA